MGFFNKIFKTVSHSVGMEAGEDPLHRVSEEDHRTAIVKERDDLCINIRSAPEKTNVQRDAGRDITFMGWMICKVEEIAIKDNKEDRRIGYLKLFKTKNDKFVCQRMTVIDDEEKHYSAATVEDIVDIKNFFGNDGLGVQLILMLDRVSRDW